MIDMMDISGLQGKDSDACIRVLALPRCITRGALCVKRCKESAQIWTKCPPSALRVQRPQLPPCIPMPQIPSSEQEQPFKSTRQTTSNDTKLQEVSRSECFLFFRYILNLTSCMVPLCPAHPTRNMPLPG